MGKYDDKLGAIHRQILALLREHEGGLTIYEIRELLPDDIQIQQHLDKRVRELRDYYKVPGVRRDGKFYYLYQGERENPVADDGHLSSKLRAQILHEAHGQCQMCGRNVSRDKIRLQIDHKKPRNWGGLTEADNLWALCEICNSGKRDYFSSYDDEMMKRLLSFDSVYERILETLRLDPSKPTPSWLLEFVANSNDYQEDWQKRARELRYPPIGVEFKVTKKKEASGKVTSYYQLTKDADLPHNHKHLIKEHEHKIKRSMRSSQ